MVDFLEFVVLKNCVLDLGMDDVLVLVLLDLLVFYICFGGCLSLWMLGWLAFVVLLLIGPLNVRL